MTDRCDARPGPALRQHASAGGGDAVEPARSASPTRGRPPRRRCAASVNRFYQPPQPEHLLLSSSPEARALSPFVDDDDLDGGGADARARAPVGVGGRRGAVARRPGPRRRRRLVARGRRTTPIRTCSSAPPSSSPTASPAAGPAASTSGSSCRAPAAGRRTCTYTLSKVEQEGPINGGLFLEDDIAEIGPGTRFTPDHDQRHVASAGLTFQPGTPRPGRGADRALRERHAGGARRRRARRAGRAARRRPRGLRARPGQAALRGRRSPCRSGCCAARRGEFTVARQRASTSSTTPTR